MAIYVKEVVVVVAVVVVVFHVVADYPHQQKNIVNQSNRKSSEMTGFQ